MGEKADVFAPVLEVVDSFVELYLSSFIRPFVQLHEKFYGGMNKVLRQLIDDNKQLIPSWFTANFITYARTAIVVPTIWLLVLEHRLIPAVLVLLVDLGDFLDGVVARFWIDIQKEIAEEKKKAGDRANSPTNSDKDSFEVVITGSPHVIDSWVHLQRSRSYGGFIDAVCDKAFLIPCWISLLHVVAPSSHFLLLQYFTLFFLVLTETCSGCIRFKAYFTAGGMPAPKVEGFDFSSSAVTADHVGKAKQTFQMVGTALFIVPFTRYCGLLLLILAVPLAYESVRRKIKSRVIYVNGDVPKFDHKTLRFWMQAKALGSMLIVGIPGENMTDKYLNACASPSVDHVIVEAPAKADLMFLEKYCIDYCIISIGQAKFVTDEVVNAKRCIQIGDDGIARPVTVKTDHKEN